MSAPSFELSGPDTPRWRAFLADAPAALSDPYYSPDYLAVNPEGGQPHYAWFTCPAGRLCLPFVLHPLPNDDGSEVSSAYGYGGPLVVGDPATVWAAFDPYWQQYCQRQGVVAELVRFHPLLNNHEGAPTGYTVTEVKANTAIDLSVPDLWAQLHPNKRRDLRQAQAKDVIVTTEAAYLPQFQALYTASLQAKQAEALYYFGPNLFEMVERWLKTGQAWLLTALWHGAPVAGALFWVGPTRVSYFLAATTDAGKRLQASNLLVWEAALRAQARGCQHLLLGGGLRNDDDLARFKRRFAPQGQVAYRLGTRIHHPERYARLSRPAGRFLSYTPGLQPQLPGLVP